MGEHTTDGRTCDTLRVVAIGDGLLVRCGCGWTSAAAVDGRDAGDRWDHHRGQGSSATSSPSMADSR